MAKYIVKRVLSAIPILFLTVTIVFILMRVIGGNPIYNMVDLTEMELDDPFVVELMERYGLDGSVGEQFVEYWKGILVGDWGYSYYNGKDVFSNISTRLEPTIMITVCSTLITVFIGVPCGVYAATHRGTWLDYTISATSVFFLSIPEFFFGVMSVYFLCFKSHLFPIQGYKYIADAGLLQSLYYVALPSLILGLSHVATVARQTRSEMLSVLGEDYIRTARAKGLSRASVNYKHALRNALAIVFTIICNSIVRMLGGSTVIEKVFNIDGIGKLAYDSLMRRDYSQEQAIILFMAIIFIAVNILLDIIYKALDPRIDFNK